LRNREIEGFGYEGCPLWRRIATACCWLGWRYCLRSRQYSARLAALERCRSWHPNERSSSEWHCALWRLCRCWLLVRFTPFRFPPPRQREAPGNSTGFIRWRWTYKLGLHQNFWHGLHKHHVCTSLWCNRFKQYCSLRTCSRNACRANRCFCYRHRWKCRFSARRR